MHTQTEVGYTYAPIGPERPAPYPDGFVPDPRRWSGREYTRVFVPEGDAPPVLHDGAPACEPAPVDARRTTARTSAMVRYIAADRLPARHLIELRHVTHDPGLLALHGERLHGTTPCNPTTVNGPLDPDAWVSPEPRLCEIRVGAILVAFDRETTRDPVHVSGVLLGFEHGRGSAHLRAWRVPPAGPPMLVHEAHDPRGDEHLIPLAALLDEPLEAAFLSLADRYATSDPPPPAHRITQLRGAIDRWRFADELARRGNPGATARGNRRRRRRRGGKARATARPAGRPANLVAAV